jgi:hypothetical protein
MEFMIKVVLSATLLSCFLLGCQPNVGELSIEQKNRVETEVNQAFKQLVKVSTELNVEQYFALIDADKFVGLNANGSNWNSIAELRQVVEPGFNFVETVESLTFPNVKISVIDAQTAVLVNEYEQTVVLAGGSRHTSRGGGVQVWSKASGQWLLVSISASAKP